MLRWISITQLWKGLEPPFLHSGLSPMALYQNPESQEDQRISKFRPQKKNKKRQWYWKGLESPELESDAITIFLLPITGQTI